MLHVSVKFSKPDAPEEADPIYKFPWKCDFGPSPSEEDMCGFLHPPGFRLKWEIHSGQTDTAGTGITVLRNQGLSHSPTPLLFSSYFCVFSFNSAFFVPPTGNYMLVEATGMEPGLRAQLISPPFSLLDFAKCLTFNFNVFGFNTGSLGILDENFEPYFSFRNRECLDIL